MGQLTSYLKNPPILLLFTVFTFAVFAGLGVVSSEFFKLKETQTLKRNVIKQTEKISHFMASVTNVVVKNSDTQQHYEIRKNFIEELVKLYPNIKSAWIKNTDGKTISQADQGNILHSKASFDHEVAIYSLVNDESHQVGSLGIQWDLTSEYSAIDARVSKLSRYAMLAAGGLFLVIFTFMLWFIYFPLKKNIFHGENILSGNFASANSISGINPAEFRILSKQTNRFAEQMRFMRHREKEIKAIINAALDAVISIDSTGNVIAFNPAAEALFGYSEVEALGADMAELIVPEELRELHRKGMSHFLKTGEEKVLGKRIEISALHSDGRIFPVELAIESIKETKGTTFVAYIRDISEQKNSEHKLANEIKHAEILSQTKSELLAATATEINAPMASVKQSLSLLQATNLSDEQQNLINVSLNSAKVLSFFMNDIAEFSKIEAGSIELDFRQFNVRDLVRDTIAIAENAVNDNEKNFTTNIASDVPSNLIGDNNRLTQILLNLLLQASKYACGSTIELRIKSILIEPSTIMLRAEVFGEKIKLPDGYRSLLKETEATNIDQNLALNFILSRKLVELMGGKIDAIDEQDNGAMFLIEIPATIIH
jgi:PAS domain S-box-containing protein